MIGNTRNTIIVSGKDGYVIRSANGNHGILQTVHDAMTIMCSTTTV